MVTFILVEEKLNKPGKIIKKIKLLELEAMKTLGYQEED